MRALVISGGGSKGAFAGGVAQYLIEELKHNYDIYVGTSTGSLMISHLALGKVDKIKNVYTSVKQEDIFSCQPFRIKKDKFGIKNIAIRHLAVLKRFFKGKKTFGESENLRALIHQTLTPEEFEVLKNSPKQIVITVSNLSLNRVEYKCLKDCSYSDFCEWVWASANFVPFMSLVEKDGYDYVDGGFGSMVPIEQAINRGADIVDVIILETEAATYDRLPARNVFSLLTDIHSYMADRIEKQNIKIGKFAAAKNNAVLNLYYTPTVLTTNPLVFDKERMTGWWQEGYEYAKRKSNTYNEIID